MKCKYVWCNDPKVQEFLRYLGVDVSITRHVIITIPLSGPITVDLNRYANNPEYRPLEERTDDDDD